MSLFCTCLLQQLEFSAVAGLLFHIVGVSTIKIQLCRTERFVILICHTVHSDFDTENSYAIYFIAWEGKEHYHLLLNAQQTA